MTGEKQQAKEKDRSEQTPPEPVESQTHDRPTGTPAETDHRRVAPGRRPLFRT